MLDGHDSLAILARDAQERGRLPGDRVVSTVMANLGLRGAPPRPGASGSSGCRSGTGTSRLRMRATGAAMGGEPSGHVVLERDGALVGDGLVAGVRVLQAARRRGATLADLRRETPRYPQVLRSVRVADAASGRGLAGARPRAVKDAERLLAGRGRVLVRYSGTEPLLRIMARGARRGGGRAGRRRDRGRGPRVRARGAGVPGGVDQGVRRITTISVAPGGKRTRSGSSAWVWAYSMGR